jgi:hypothetical protein
MNPSIHNKEEPLAPSKKPSYHPNPHSPGQHLPKNHLLCPKSPPQLCRQGKGRCKLPLPQKGKTSSETNPLIKTNLREEVPVETQEDHPMTPTGKDREQARLTMVALETFLEAAEEGN